jgi:hypothetical protein
MINIISKQAKELNIHGPYKVYNNLIKGLIKLKYPFIVNRDLNSTKRLWVHDNLEILKYLNKSNAYKIIGPNLVNLPNELPIKKFKKTIYVMPSIWPIKLWKSLNFTSCPIVKWPVGIDTDIYKPIKTNKLEKRVMIYHKRRNTKELIKIIDVLYKLKLPYWLVDYGQYEENEYKKLLGKTSFIIWHDGSETQGIAMLEAMSCNIPIIVCNAKRLKQSEGGYQYPKKFDNFEVTSAPYFDKKCGIIINNIKSIEKNIEIFLDNKNEYSPREYVLKNLNIEKQAREFICLWERWNLNFQEGYEEKILNKGELVKPSNKNLIDAYKKLLNILIRLLKKLNSNI